MRSHRAAQPKIAVLWCAALLLSGCGAAEDAARNAVGSAGDAAKTAASGAVSAGVRDAAKKAADSALRQLPGTCRDWTASASAARTAQAATLLQSLWLADGHASTPSGQQVDDFAGALDATCQSSPDTVLREVVPKVYADTASVKP